VGGGGVFDGGILQFRDDQSRETTETAIAAGGIVQGGGIWSGGPQPKYAPSSISRDRHPETPRNVRVSRPWLTGTMSTGEYASGMSRAALLAAVLLVPSAPNASIDFGPVQLGGAAHRMLRVSALKASASGAGFSASRTKGGVLIVFEPYELGEQATGTLTLKTTSGLIRIRLRGHGIDTMPPSVTVETPVAATAGHPLLIRFEATDNDLVSTCTIKINGQTIARLLWPASTFRWLVPAGTRRPIRITVVAVDRAGNHASATTKPVPIRP
jgi:hypothetical protein